MLYMINKSSCLYNIFSFYINLQIFTHVLSKNFVKSDFFSMVKMTETVIK